MPPSPPPSSKAISLASAKGSAVAPSRHRRDRDDPTVPALLEFQSPSAGLLAVPVPRSARGVVWIIATMFAACLVALGLIKIDRVVTTQGKVVSAASLIVVQPLETSIVRSVKVKEGQTVHAGDILAELDPTFAAADEGALANQVATLQAEVTRLRAEAEGKPFVYTGNDPALELQAAVFAQREAEKNYKLETYRQRIAGLQATMQRAISDVAAYQERLVGAQRVEEMRKELERQQVGSKLNTLAAVDTRLEMQRNLQEQIHAVQSARNDMDAMIGERDSYLQNWKGDTSQKLSEESQKLTEARESLNKAQLKRQLVDLRADRDGTVLSVNHASVGSVLQSGNEFITLVPADAPLEVESNISGRDDGFVHVGDPVAIKFDTFPFAQYGLARGTVRIISADSFTAQDQARGRTEAAVPVSPNSTEPYYKARIAIDKVELRNVPEGFHLVPGMPITADIKVGQRTVMNYLLGRILPTVQTGMREP